MLFLGVDAGTTHCKAGLFGVGGRQTRGVSRPTPTHTAQQGFPIYHPEEIWQLIAGLIRELALGAGGEPIAAIGISSTAETGLLVDRTRSIALTEIYPWYATFAQPQAERLANLPDPYERFCRSGIYPTYKCSLAKLLWIQENTPALMEGSTWLSMADFLAYRLTGCLGTDLSLAGRTYAFRIDTKNWDEERLRMLGLPADIFPPAAQAGAPLGQTMHSVERLTGLPAGIPVAVTGHDHVCGASGAGVVSPGQVFDSMGTAETFMGVFEERRLGDNEYRSGLSYGWHTTGGRMYWMGGLSASGGSVEWLRTVINHPPLSYPELDAILSELDDRPGRILYFPYLSGSGSPHTDPHVRGAFVGLDAAHTRSDLLKAVLEGTAYELELIRRAGEEAGGVAIQRILAAGGGTRNRRWLQIKADISGCRIEVQENPEMVLAGAAMLAGTGAGVSSIEDWFSNTARQTRPEIYLPDPNRHNAYQKIYHECFLPFQEPLKQISRGLND